MLTGMPPALRRRVITSLNAEGLRSMLSDMTAMIDAFEKRDTAKGRTLLAHQFASFTPFVVEANESFNKVAGEDEVNYAPGQDLLKPVFRSVDSDLPLFFKGIREPLSWAEFKALQALL